jgi:iron complex transport system substrate-binding protein
MPARRITSLLASGTEIVYALGLGERVVAVSHECDYPADVLSKPRVTKTLVHAAGTSRQIDEQVRGMSAGGAALYEIDTPRLAALRPDLIVTQAQCDVCAVRYADVVCAVETMPELRGTQVVALNPQTYDDIFDDIRRVGQAAGCTAAAERLVGMLTARVAAVSERAGGQRGYFTLRDAGPAERDDDDAGSRPLLSQRPRVVGLEWLDPIMVAGNWMPEMIALAGGVCRLTEAGRHSPYVPWPMVVAEDPEVIIVMPCGFDLKRTLAEAALLPRLPSWGDISAVRAGRVYAVDGNAYFNRSGPRMVDSLEILAHLIHPDVFPPPVDRKAYVKIA